MICTYDPRPLALLPIGMFHCPECGDIVLAGMPHPMSDSEMNKEIEDKRFNHHKNECIYVDCTLHE